MDFRWLSSAYTNFSKSAYSTGIISLDFLLRTSTDLAKGLHGTLLCNIGFMYRDAGDSLNAYKVHQQAITLTLKNSDPENLVYAYTKAGETYGHFKNLSKKMEFLKKKYDLYKSIKNDQKSGVQAGVIGKEYEEQRKNYQTANQYYLLSMDHFKKANDFDGLAEAYWNYGYNLDQNQKKYKEAIDNYRKSSALYAQLNDTTNWKTEICSSVLLGGGGFAGGLEVAIRK